MAFPSDLPYMTIKPEKEENVLKTKMQSGFVQARKKYTKTKKTFHIELNLVEIALANELDAFYDLVEMYTSFIWVNPDDNITYDVRFGTPVVIHKNPSYPNHKVVENFTLEEA